MSLCEPCQLAQPVPVCTQNLTLGTITSTNEDVYIYFHNIKNGRFERTTATSDIAGLVIADLTQFKPMSRNTYEVWVTKTSAVSNDDREAITIDAIVSDCLNIEFERVTGEANYTLSL